MDARERVTTVLNGGVPDRVPFHDNYWQATVARWRREGLPEDVDPGDYFDCDIAQIGGSMKWNDSRAGFDDTLQLPPVTIAQTARKRTLVDANGATRREMSELDDWTPSWLDFSIKGRDDWRRLRDRAEYNPTRVAEGTLDAYRAARDRGKFCAYFIHGCFHPTWHKVGMEQLFYWLRDDPELVTDMFAAHTRLVIDLYEATKAMGVEYDGAWLLDDLGYTNGPMISPEMYRELVMPFHKQACDHFARDGLRTILHSDGDVRPLIPLFLEAGFAALHPLEAKAGLDVADLKATYGDRLTLFGNIDVRKLAGTREEVEEEVRSKIAAAGEGGGYIFHSDHSVPSDVSFENYSLAADLVRVVGWYG